MINRASLINFRDPNFGIKMIVMVVILCLMYYWAPFFVMDLLTDIGFYQDYKLTNLQIYLELLSTFIILYTAFLCIYFIKSLNIDFLKIERIRKQNKLVSNYSVALLSLSSLPLLYFWFQNQGAGREELYDIILQARQNVIMSIVFTIALVSSIVELYYGQKKYILFVFFIGILPELLYGTRISVFRFVFLLAVVMKWNFRMLAISIGLFMFIGMSRSIFTGYSSESLYDFIILFLGDPVNIFLGTSKILQFNNMICGIDGMHVLKPFTFPFIVRGFFDDYMGDIAICMGTYGVSGLGNTLPNELYIAPLSVVLMLMLLTIFFIFTRYKKFNPLINIYFILIVISVFPYIMRNGFIATVNHIVTIVLWFLIPLFLILAIKNNYKKRINAN